MVYSPYFAKIRVYFVSKLIMMLFIGAQHSSAIQIRDYEMLRNIRIAQHNTTCAAKDRKYRWMDIFGISNVAHAKLQVYIFMFVPKSTSTHTQCTHIMNIMIDNYILFCVHLIKFSANLPTHLTRCTLSPCVWYHVSACVSPACVFICIMCGSRYQGYLRCDQIKL